MMEIPDIHTCGHLNAENIKLKKRISKLHETNKGLKMQLLNLTEKSKVEEMLKNFVTTRSTYVQTEGGSRTYARIQKKEPKPMAGIEEAAKTKKLMSMHNSLMRRYEKELKINMEHTDTITALSLKVNELEMKLQEEKLQAVTAKQKDATPGKKNKKNVRLDNARLKELSVENERLKKENDKFRKELTGLDKGFFDEIKDLKYGLQQSAKLNREYEKTLYRLCKQFGVPYPHPEGRIMQ
ncbi:uncharacterized protein LOC141902658 [Tubulanus polymorphus]|uniref:uncharacterized protein LOC141902658 n=1 Tax=Tubulanus polymorphus TaxID=672921 RepID=UPI003DA45BD0